MSKRSAPQPERGGREIDPSDTPREHVRLCCNHSARALEEAGSASSDESHNGFVGVEDRAQPRYCPLSPWPTTLTKPNIQLERPWARFTHITR